MGIGGDVSQSDLFQQKGGIFLPWVINIIIGVHAYQYFLVHCAPFVDLVDEITQEYFSQIQVNYALGLE